MSIAITLSPTMTSQLQTEATLLGISLNELVEKLLSQSLSQLEFSKQYWQATARPAITTLSEDIEDSTHSVPNENVSDNISQDTPSNMAEIITRIKSRPRNPHSFHPATGTIDDVLAAIDATASDEPPLTAEEWETHWWPIREEMRERDKMKDIDTIS